MKLSLSQSRRASRYCKLDSVTRLESKCSSLWLSVALVKVALDKMIHLRASLHGKAIIRLVASFLHLVIILSLSIPSEMLLLFEVELDFSLSQVRRPGLARSEAALAYYFLLFAPI